MALAHTILATLADAPHTGYDLWKTFEDSVRCFWKASQQQIYRELGKMEKQGLVTSEVIPQVGRPDKKLYSITKEGLEELITWTKEPSEPTAIREDLLVKVKAGYLLPREAILQELEHRRQIHQQQLDSYRAKEQDFPKPPEKLSFQEKCRYLTLKRGIIYESEWLDWCDEAIALFQSSGNCQQDMDSTSVLLQLGQDISC